jgi:hypothetical protein
MKKAIAKIENCTFSLAILHYIAGDALTFAIPTHSRAICSASDCTLLWLLTFS